MQLTHEQALGLKFELWLSSVVRELGGNNEYTRVYHNVEVHRARYEFRQLDIVYTIRKQGAARLALIEAKYTTAHTLPFLLRGGPKRKSGQLVPRLDNIIDETYERTLFSGIPTSYLVTNSRVDDQAAILARRYGLSILEAPDLECIWKNLGHRSRVNDSILQTPIPASALSKITLPYPLAPFLVVQNTTPPAYIRRMAHTG